MDDQMERQKGWCLRRLGLVPLFKTSAPDKHPWIYNKLLITFAGLYIKAHLTSITICLKKKK